MNEYQPSPEEARKKLLESGHNPDHKALFMPRENHDNPEILQWIEEMNTCVRAIHKVS